MFYRITPQPRPRQPMLSHGRQTDGRRTTGGIQIVLNTWVGLSQLSSLALVACIFPARGTFTYVLLAHSVGILAYSWSTLWAVPIPSRKGKSNDACVAEQDSATRHKGAQGQLNLRNKKMETLVNELKKHESTSSMEQDHTLASQQHEQTCNV